MRALLRRRSASLALVAVAALAVVPAPATASPEALIRDCQDGTISGRYSARDYTRALRDIPTDVDEYTDCRDVIRRAQLGAAGGGRAGGSGGGAGEAGGAGGGTGGGRAGTPGAAPDSVEQVLASATPQERASIRQAAASGGSAPVVVGGQSIDPREIARGARAGSSSLPPTLLAALLLLAVGAAAASVHQLRTRVLGRRAAG